MTTLKIEAVLLKLLKSFFIIFFCSNIPQRSKLFDSATNGIFLYLKLKSVLTMYWGTYIIWFAGIKAAVQLHRSLLSNMLHCPMDFFDVTPMGRILARFSNDVNVIDDRLIQCIRHSVMTTFRVRFRSFCALNAKLSSFKVVEFLE